MAVAQFNLVGPYQPFNWTVSDVPAHRHAIATLIFGSAKLSRANFGLFHAISSIVSLSGITIHQFIRGIVWNDLAVSLMRFDVWVSPAARVQITFTQNGYYPATPRYCGHGPQ